MSKRLNKRQQRELEELEALKEEQRKASLAGAAEADDNDGEEDNVEQDDDDTAGPVNPFAALDAKADQAADEDEDEDDEVAPSSAPKKSKKKKPKKKKAQPAAGVAGDDDTAPPSQTTTPAGKAGGKGKRKGASDPLEGMDEVDRALAELKIKYGEEQAGPSRVFEGVDEPSQSRSTLAFRNLLSVDPKNLDADAELRRFFGSKVIASAASSGPNRHRPGPSSKIRYTLAKPKPTYPPPTSLAGLGMREMTDEEVVEMYDRRGRDQTDKGEKWYSFEHSGQWIEVERQFLGAVRSHDPNQLMALLQVYPWHVDTLLQMSEVYRLQSDIGAASDYAERALYAFDRCLLPGFSVQSGASRVDFDRVENRPMFTALHRIISYLGRRGCWVTAFNFAKLLFSLDPEGDPHGAAFWLDFLAVKSGHGAWLLSMLEQREHSPAVAVWHAYPGMAYARALAIRADEEARKSKTHEESDAALRQAIKAFPQVVMLLADKIGANVPDSARSEPLLQIEAGHTNLPTNVLHLLSHIYVARSEALWKEPTLLKWFETTLASTLDEIDNTSARALRSEALATIQTPRDPVDESINVPLFICRHVMCSESTSWLGFLPASITKRAFHAYDPLPPTTATSLYDADYFTGRSSRAAGAVGRRGAGPTERGGEGLPPLGDGVLQAFYGGLRALANRAREAAGGGAGAAAGAGAELNEDQQNELNGIVEFWRNFGAGDVNEEDLRALILANANADGEMPGAFPGQGGDEAWEDEDEDEE